MTGNIDVLGVEVDCLTAKEAMLQAMRFMENDSVDTIEILTMDALMNGREDMDWKELVKKSGLVLPGEMEILKAADIHDRVMLKETENLTFLKLFIKYLQKNQKKVFLLAETQEALECAEEKIRRYNRGILITGRGVLASDGSGEENMINEINGTETDCIVSVLPSPYQERFIAGKKALLNIKVWLGCGAVVAGRLYGGKKALGRMRHFFRKILFSWRVGKEQ